MENNDSYALQASTADPLFLWFLLGALKEHDEEFLEATALDYLETFHADKVHVAELHHALDQIDANKSEKTLATSAD